MKLIRPATDFLGSRGKKIVMIVNDREDMSYVMQRIYDRHRENENDDVRELSRAAVHLYKKVYELTETVDSLESRIDELESQR
jgi:hypothetical protein